MKIAEIYPSIQGEGLLAGQPSVFVRASGCNLRCWFCDTPYTSWQPEGSDLSVEMIVAQLAEWDTEHVVLTGGEPMLFAESIPLTTALRELGKHITIETAGTLYLPVECDLMSISPKLSNSSPQGPRDAAWRRRHEQSRHAPAVIGRLLAEYDYQLKFVIDTPADVAEVEEYLQAFPEVDRARVLLMPQCADAEQLGRQATWLEPLCRAEGWRYGARRQLEWFGAARGT
ncbi:MAG: 7-carboxy-7-deazaguanine synthase QueE [Planctomycetota bacterium]|nr:MAG: 7-carboxy-7-deazaguanine synthase QueE [Planctomycetota bacterium]REJ92870.1 MAG: 7-carboxy-7-deazaguanine synthase QueE [Planctomycetota bacterium]REK27917.1 MAG: 7-carboxy-7-deazaguanine synthase QueE [Planctomycetota bacterium]REK40356.1 MAG: 7-carboxy-7-deazaguanine synthase QueE [Planctomycetota bacterium]